ncbi:MAG: hypothetical protein OEY44_04720 [Candidatus Peregrinibacteria bacterium]|nr:hypothetical protein [Candidatus Peregrinibacteria bacterium]
MGNAEELKNWPGNDRFEEILSDLRSGYIERFRVKLRRIPSGPVDPIEAKLTEAARYGVEVCLGARSMDSGSLFKEGISGSEINLKGAKTVMSMFPELDIEASVRHGFIQTALGGRGDYAKQIQDAFPDIITPEFVGEAKFNERFASIYPE